MSILWLLQIARSLMIPLAIATALFLSYTKVKHIGYEEASIKYEQILADKVKVNEQKLDNLEKLSVKLVQITTESDISNAKSIGKISDSIKGKSLVILKDGECKPSPTFLGSFEEINKRVNQSIEGIAK